MEELAEALAVNDVGLEGCAQARPQGKRQDLQMDRETLDIFELAPAIVRENVTTEGLDVNGLVIGQPLRIGEVEWQVSAVCDASEQIEALRPGCRRSRDGGPRCRRWCEAECCGAGMRLWSEKEWKPELEEIESRGRLRRRRA
jgi:hypothetical protein